MKDFLEISCTSAAHRRMLVTVGPHEKAIETNESLLLGGFFTKQLTTTEVQDLQQIFDVLSERNKL